MEAQRKHTLASNEGCSHRVLDHVSDVAHGEANNGACEPLCEGVQEETRKDLQMGTHQRGCGARKTSLSYGPHSSSHVQ